MKHTCANCKQAFTQDNPPVADLPIEVTFKNDRVLYLPDMFAEGQICFDCIVAIRTNILYISPDVTFDHVVVVSL